MPAACSRSPTARGVKVSQRLGGRKPSGLGRLAVWAAGSEAVMLLAEAFTLGQRGLPVLLQLPCHQAVFGFSELVLAPGPVRGELGAFQALPPDPVHLRAPGLYLPGRGERDLQRGGCERVQQQPGDVTVQAPAGELLALAASVVGLLAGADVDRGQPPAPPPLGADRHPLAPAPPARAAGRPCPPPPWGPPPTPPPRWRRLPPRKHRPALPGPSRSNRSKPGRPPAWPCSSGSRPPSPGGRRAKPAGSGTASCPR